MTIGEGVRKSGPFLAAAGVVGGVLMGANAAAESRRPDVVCQVQPSKEAFVPRAMAVGGAVLDTVVVTIGERIPQAVEPFHAVPYPEDDQGREYIGVLVSGHDPMTGDQLAGGCDGMTMPREMRE